MSNMSYCRWQNTADDFSDCLESLDENNELGEAETRAKKWMIELCRGFLEGEGFEVEEHYYWWR